MKLRCLLGHSWTGDGPYSCARCPKTSTPCDNCGGHHHPEHITICVVTR